LTGSTNAAKRPAHELDKQVSQPEQIWLDMIFLYYSLLLLSAQAIINVIMQGTSGNSGKYMLVLRQI